MRNPPPDATQPPQGERPLVQGLDDDTVRDLEAGGWVPDPDRRNQGDLYFSDGGYRFAGPDGAYVSFHTRTYGESPGVYWADLTEPDGRVRELRSEEDEADMSHADFVGWVAGAEPEAGEELEES